MNTVGDFINDYQIALDGKTSEKLEAFIPIVEKDVLYDMLGVELADLFILDLAKADVDREQRFKDLEAPINFEYACKVYRNKGMSETLRCFIYFKYVRKQTVRNTISGNKKNVSELSESSGKAYVLSIHNRGVNYYNVVQQFILQNQDAYPEFQGTVKSYASLI